MTKKKLKDNIPSKVRITSKVSYEVVFIDSFPDENQLGECRYYEKQIVLKNGLSDSETWSVFIHEIIHGISFEYGEKTALTETQVLWLEKGLKNFIRLNKLV
jgi:hypothetical protein